MFKFVDEKTIRRTQVWLLCDKIHDKYCLCRYYCFKSCDLTFPSIFLYRCLTTLCHSHKKT